MPKFTAPGAGETAPNSEIFCVRFSPDDQYVAASYADGSIRVYNAATGRQEFFLNKPDAEKGGALPTTQVRWRPMNAQSKTKNVLISVNAESDGCVQHWHIKSGKCLHSITEKGNQLFCIDYVQDGSTFGTAGRDRVLRIYDEATKRLVQSLSGGDQVKTAGHSNRVFSLKFHPESPNVIVSGGWDNTAQIWDLRKGHSVRSIYGCYICGDSVDVSMDGKTLLTGSWRVDESVQLWDFGTAKCIETLQWKQSAGPSPGQVIDGNCMVFSAQFSKDPSSSLIVAGGSQENEAKVFDRTKGNKVVGAVMALNKPVFSVDFSCGMAQPEMVAVGGADGQVRVFNVSGT